MHVSITDHKIGLHDNLKKEKGDFLGLVAINNVNPTNLSKAKAYLKHYESFEANPIYLDSSKHYLDRLSIELSFSLYVKYYYLQQEYKAIINLDMKYSGKDFFGNNKEEKALCFSRIAESYALSDMDEKALSYYKDANKLSPYHLDIKIKLGVQRLKMKDLSAAKKEFLSVIEEYPEYKQAYCNLGYLAILENDFKLADSYLNKAIHLDPDYVQAYENLVLSAQIQNKKEQAKVYLNKILEIAPEHKAKEILSKL
jgi:tetratricopeptide (TPR) repeat protein